MSCQLGSIAVGSVAIITINVTATTFSSASLSTNTATVSSPLPRDPNLSNNTSTADPTIQSPTAVDIASSTPFAQPDGSVMLEWSTHEESRNLGFHIYREQAAGRKRITPSLIAGSALLLRGSQPQHAAKLYRWIDSQPSAGASYSIEDVDINGTRTMHGPASFRIASPAERKFAVLRLTPSLGLATLASSCVPTPRPSASRLPGCYHSAPHPLPLFPTGFRVIHVADLPP